MKILRGTVNSASSSSSIHRVKVTVPGVCDSLLMDTVNGLYLRTNDEVFVYFEEDYNSPLVLGRCSGQLEIQDLVTLINNLVDVFNNHTHILTPALTASGIPVEGTVACASPTTKQTKAKPDDLLY